VLFDFEFLDRHLNQVLSFQLKFSCYGQAVSMQETFFNKYFITQVHHPLRVNLPLSIFHLVLNRPKWRFITNLGNFDINGMPLQLSASPHL
jgi:hypothetical protein